MYMLTFSQVTATISETPGTQLAGIKHCVCQHSNALLLRMRIIGCRNLKISVTASQPSTLLRGLCTVHYCEGLLWEVGSVTAARLT